MWNYVIKTEVCTRYIFPVWMFTPFFPLCPLDLYLFSLFPRIVNNHYEAKPLWLSSYLLGINDWPEVCGSYQADNLHYKPDYFTIDRINRGQRFHRIKHANMSKILNGIYIPFHESQFWLSEMKLFTQTQIIDHKGLEKMHTIYEVLVITI